jgi:hypothetical protein
MVLESDGHGLTCNPHGVREYRSRFYRNLVLELQNSGYLCHRVKGRYYRVTVRVV